ncbi:MAG: acetate--CoA ligase family protein [Prevotellaceae bacterium]|jgi:acetyltransferase|nr:acetate--CoA ligase family protein [Prevotellaceae bacterium]
MINPKLLNPQSIVVIGASKDLTKPGGKVLKNLLNSNFGGKIFAVNPKETEIQGVKCYAQIDDLPQVDCAILAVAAKYCPSAVETLAERKDTGGFIILSAGFSEENADGAALERRIVKAVNAVNGSLIGPNCTGFLNTNYCGAFDAPIPPLDPRGVEFITGSGATAVFIKEYGISNGLTFSSVWAVGNSAQMGIEDVLEHLDLTFDPATSSRTIMLYMETIREPQKLLQSAVSLINKGCRIAAIKSGNSAAGSRAASSHTGALTSSDAAVDALFRKAGIARCHSREELTAVCSVFMFPELRGNNIAIITHAGGPAVMLTDVLSGNGLQVPHIEGTKAEDLLQKLFAGSSVGNPIDFLATGTAEQLGTIIDYCQNEFQNIDAMAVIYGSPGLFPNWEVYRVLDEKIKTCSKPIFPVLPSIINVKDEIQDFIFNKKNINFPEECVLGNALVKIAHTPKPQIRVLPPSICDEQAIRGVQFDKIREIIEGAESGYLKNAHIAALLDAAGIGRKPEIVVDNIEEAIDFVRKIGFPVVLKVVGPLHKSDVGGVVLNVNDETTVRKEFARLMQIPDTYAVEIDKMLFGAELFAGVKRELPFGHLLLFGLGGIFVEIMNDVQTVLAPACKDEILSMIKRLRGYRIFQGVRGQSPVNEHLFAEIIAQLSALTQAAPEIAEMDLNPLIANSQGITVVDARIRIEKK